VAVSFDCFGTLVDAQRPAEPWVAVADALRARSISVPDDWETAYRSSHVEVEPLAELSLVEHTQAALASRDVEADADTIHDALFAAFDGPVTVVDGARPALRAAAREEPVGVLSNCSVPGLVERTLAQADLAGAVDHVVTSVDCGWRKPHDRAFTRAAAALGTDVDSLIHVGDDPRTDGGGRTAGVTVILTSETPLTAVPAKLEAGL